MPPEAVTASPWAARTLRKDAWWVEPALVVAVFTAFLAYATFRVFENAFFVSGVYLSPFATPDLTFLVPGILTALPFVGTFLTYPAFLILPVPAGFRFTCYYYRKAYYRSFAGLPPGCAVSGTTDRGYQGERGLLAFQNLHRYFLYAALLVLVFLWYDALLAFGLGTGQLYVGAGSLLFLGNVVLLSFYTLGCHSLRHLVGGKLDCYSCDLPSRLRHRLWGRVTMLNQRHMLWAWLSLFSVAFTDFYVRLLATGSLADPVLFTAGVPW